MACPAVALAKGEASKAAARVADPLSSRPEIPAPVNRTPRGGARGPQQRGRGRAHARRVYSPCGASALAVRLVPGFSKHSHSWCACPERLSARRDGPALFQWLCAGTRRIWSAVAERQRRHRFGGKLAHFPKRCRTVAVLGSVFPQLKHSMRGCGGIAPHRSSGTV